MGKRFPDPLRTGETILFNQTVEDLTMLELSTRETLYLRVDKIAGVQELQSGGCRILLAAGGYVDVCGTAQVWRHEIALANARIAVI